ncbi:hypothetical protein PT276_09010 [Orbaceae bacterium ESL0721]|nr:hypothetical protein [Orbaceae bacterium ESL0721]
MSANTTGIIEGHAPYLSFDNGVTKATNTDELLTIKLSNGVTYSQTNNPSTADNPIELPVIGQTIADVQMFVPSDVNSVNLNTLISDPYNYWYDSDGDSGVLATGSLQLQIVDEYGNVLGRSDKLDSCTGARYYKVTLVSSAGGLKTEYGYPADTHYDGASAIYYIKPKVDPTVVPTACYAQPSLTFSSTDPFGSPQHSYDWDGPTNQWDSKKGFFLQDMHNPSSNFPTMGAYGLFFNLIIANPKGEISYTKEPASSGIDLRLTTITSNNIKIFLTGPRHGASAASAATAVPTTFTIKSGNTPVYSFRIGKWFIGSGNYDSTYDANYCRNTYGGGYRIPDTIEYSNGNGFNWWGGLSGQPDNYQRRIGGGFNAEWGNMCNNPAYLADCEKMSIYTDTDFHEPYFWASESYNTGQLVINTYAGGVGAAVYSPYTSHFACVTP